MQQSSGSQSISRRHSGEQRRKTRDLILQTARELFNEQGAANVTLAHIGEQLGISEGNVWYHFHTKHDLIFALFSELQTQVQANQQFDPDNLRHISTIAELLAQRFQLIWEYRFLFRDHINWAVAQRDVHEQLVTLTTRGRQFIQELLEHMLQLELLQIEQRDIPILATNIWIVSRYWIDYCQTRSEQRQITEQDIQGGIQQILALVRPYFTPTALHMLDNIA